MATHVFIVNDKTFKYHLEFMFAGTGAGDKVPLFLSNSNEKYNASTERNLVGMVADISRVRVGDEVIFYLTGCAKFYGFFRVRRTAFADVNGTYLLDELEKKLTFRVLLEPTEVYAEGITEHECLDSLNGINKPHEMCWSLIYRKLKGNRGCTAIFDYEAARIKTLIKAKNNNVMITGNGFTYDNASDKVVTFADTSAYSGIVESIAIKERLLNKATTGKAFEVHLQGYIMQEFESIKPLLGISSTCWFANEVSCGVGMQRIDMMAVVSNKNNVTIKVVELKHGLPTANIIHSQLPWYVKWCSEYVVPNFGEKNVAIDPIVLAHSFGNNQLLSAFKQTAYAHTMSASNAVVALPQFVSFKFDSNSILFTKEF